MNYERVSKSWTQEQAPKAIQDTPKPDTGGPAPMDIDRVEKGKGKGKDKGKEKGKGGHGGAWDAGAWMFGRGRGKGNYKGKGKKGKGRGKGKGKNKGKKGQGKTKAGPNQCSICFGYGHWSRECPRRMEVNQVQQQPAPHFFPSPAKHFNLLDHQHIHHCLMDLQQQGRVRDHQLQALLDQL